MAAPAHHLQGLTVLERGWLSSNNVLIHPAPGEAGAVLVDSGHVNHEQQTVALVRHALGDAPLACVVNTHLHSDHCGGNAALQQAFGVPVWVPPGEADAIRAWDQGRLSYEATGQRIRRFTVDGTLEPGRPLRAGGRDWQVLAAPGHDPHSVMLFDDARGVLMSADALWENGFGVVFPEVVGDAGFADVGATLDLVASLPVQIVIPGHGSPFTDVAGALERARRRLDAFRADPVKHLRHAAKVFIKYHLMEEGSMSLDELQAWAVRTPLMQPGRARAAQMGQPVMQDTAAWVASLLGELERAGALRIEGARVLDR